MQNIPRLLANNAILFVCDMQEKFRSTVYLFPEVVVNVKKLIDSARDMKIPLIITEQYPYGLGSTIDELNVSDVTKFEKTKFSMFIDPVLKHLNTLKEDNPKSIILCGIETHACIQQTVYDLLDNKHNVFLIADATSSRSPLDREIAMKLMAQLGVTIMTTESVILTLLGDASHPQFKTIHQYIRKPSKNEAFRY